MHNPILLTASCAVVSFFIGAIPFGLILGRVFNHTDIRKAGSGNIGTTNALRVAGPKVAALTLLLDCLKGAICVLIARPLIAGVGYGFPVSIMAPGAPGDWMLGVICLAAVWGHIFSPYLNFHGGKGIAVGLGVILAWCWPIGLSLLGHVYRGRCHHQVCVGGLACRGHRSSHRRLCGLSVQQPGTQVLHGADRHHRGVGPSCEHQKAHDG